MAGRSDDRQRQASQSKVSGPCGTGEWNGGEDDWDPSILDLCYYPYSRVSMLFGTPSLLSFQFFVIVFLYLFL